MKRLLLILLVNICLVNCTSLVKPSSINNTMIIGGLSANLAGNKLEIYIRSVSTNEVLKADIKNEIFYFTNIDGQEYYIYQIRNRKTGIAYTLTGDTRFSVENNCVNNIGLIFLTPGNDLKLVNQHNIVKINFNKTFKKSAWNNKNWVNYEWTIGEQGKIQEERKEKIIEIENNAYISEENLMILLLTSSEDTGFIDKEGFRLKGIDELDFSDIDKMESVDINNDELLEFIIEGHLNIPD